MLYLLLFILAYLIGTLLVLLRNMAEFIPAGSSDKAVEKPATPLASILIPARNEESVIAKCVESVLAQDYPNFEIIVLDDRSEDATKSILESLKQNDIHHCLTVLEGNGNVDGWLGKPRACDQLSKSANGEVLVFIDADTWMEKHTISDIVRAFEQDQVDALTIWPQQHFGSFWEKIAVPMVYFALTTLLPAVYVRRDPRWMPNFARPYFRTAFAAACGQCFAFKRSTYDAIDGHASVKDQIVEDVELAKIIKSKGYKLSMYHGIDQFHCRMYTSKEEVFSGFRKNFLRGFGDNIPFFLSAAVAHIVVFLVPYVVFVSALVMGETVLTILSGLAIFLIHLQRFLLDVRNKWSPGMGLLHGLGVIWFQRLGITVIRDYFGKRSVMWKGRTVR